MNPKPQVAVSACLLGEPVRYDGHHKRNPVVMNILGPQVDFVAVCPEVEVGMGIPAPASTILLIVSWA